MSSIKRSSSHDASAVSAEVEAENLVIQHEVIIDLHQDACVHEHVFLGGVHATRKPARLITILGSCVAICLYDTKNKVGGMNHFVLPGSPPAHESDHLRWADTSIAELFIKVIDLGASMQSLQAKVFGGAQLADRPGLAELKIGERNINHALQELSDRNIVVSNRCVGGSAGRKIVFEPHTGNAWVKEFHRVIH